MFSKKIALLVLSFLTSRSVFAQLAPSDIQSAVEKTPRTVSWGELVPNILSDQGHIWTFPTRVYHKKILYPTLGVLAVTAGLIALDPTEAKYFRQTNAYHGFNSVFSSTATAWGTALVPASIYLSGLARKDSYAQKTALFAGEAVADAEIVDAVFKRATRRVRPADLPPNATFGDTWFEAKNGYVNGNGSFVSGHTIAAFAVATVVARRYGTHRWVPYAAYGLATAVGLSRVSLSAHYGSDVFLGAALGYSIARFSVLRH
jgi:membrane-associated phospholipid phosphatase